jgi:hypothetical protein
MKENVQFVAVKYTTLYNQRHSWHSLISCSIDVRAVIFVLHGMSTKSSSLIHSRLEVCGCDFSHPVNIFKICEVPHPAYYSISCYPLLNRSDMVYTVNRTSRELFSLCHLPVYLQCNSISA